ncbi:MAG: hypothetical protein C4K49_08425 [Candidatus Thorarchaeota archaeon]|nr:MAG: hypothetical protein C4K49_08425 [Candidatus Thorarchaeota archaeon]
MGITKTAAVKGLIPAGNKVKELRGNLNRLMTEMPTVLEDRFGQAGLDAVAEIFRNLGAQDAATMKTRLGLGDTLRDSLDAWKVVGNVMGAKMVPKWVSETRVETNHPYCPQYEEFMKQGKLYCDSVCLPYVRAIAEGVSPKVKMEVVRAANKEATCIKALVYSP